MKTRSCYSTKKFPRKRGSLGPLCLLLSRKMRRVTTQMNRWLVESMFPSFSLYDKILSNKSIIVSGGTEIRCPITYSKDLKV